MSENECVSCGEKLGEKTGVTCMNEPLCEPCGERLTVAQDRVFAGEYGPHWMEAMFCSDTDAFRRKQAAVKKMGWDEAKRMMNEVVDRVRARRKAQAHICAR